MSTLSIPTLATNRDLIPKVVTAGLTVGVLDTFGAIAHSLIIRGQARPIAIFQGIASVLLGEEAMSGGLATASLGLLMHFCVALTWASVYGLIYSRWGWLRTTTRSTAGAVAVGFVFGPIVWLMMRFVVLPVLTETGPVKLGSFLLMVVVHMLCVGLPIASIVRARAT